MLVAVAATISLLPDRLVRVPGLAGRRLGPAGVSEEAALIVRSDPVTIRRQRAAVKRKTQDVVVRLMGTPLDVAVYVLMGERTRRSCVEKIALRVDPCLGPCGEVASGCGSAVDEPEL